MSRASDFSLATKGILVVAIPVTALLVAMVVFYQFEQQAQQAQRAVEDTLELRSAIRRVLAGMINAETGIRGYLLTQRPAFLEPYEAALQELPALRSNLRQLAQDDPAQAQRILSLDSLIADLLGAMERSRLEIARGDEPEAMAELEPNREAMNALRRELEAMTGDAQRRLADRASVARQLERRTSVAIFAGGALGLLGGVIATLIFTTSITRRVRHLQEEAREVASGQRILHEPSGADEIGLLERTLKETSDLLTTRAEELRRTQNDLETRVEQRTAELTAANEALRTSNEVRETLIQSSPLATWAVDLGGKVIFWNPAAEHIFGWSEREVIGRPVPIVPEDQAEEFRGWLEQYGKGERLSGIERKRRRKDGSEVDVMIWTAPLRDSEGRIRGAIAIDSDVSQQKSLEEQFRQSQKLEAVGRLAGGVAHDFNNLLTVIRGYTDMIEMEAGGAPTLAEYTQEVRYAADRAASLTAQLLAFSRRQVSQPKVLDLNEIVTHSMKLLHRVIGEDVAVVTNLEPDLPKVKADPIHIDQVIMNLVVNARDAMPGDGRLTIETSTQSLDSEYSGRHLGVEPGRYVMLAISDNGAGMTAEVRNRIFEPFFTTKEAGKGTGLGLSIVYGIVKQNRGEIIVYSEPGRGTTFKIYLPIVDAPAELAPSVERPLEMHGTETILVCEDDPKIRVLVERILGRQGYGVLSAETAEAALLMSRETPDTIHLLLTDVVMPRMSGFELAKLLGRTRPKMRVLYMSGYTDSQILDGSTIDQDTPLLQKPFTAAKLSQTVRAILDAE